MDYLPRPGIVCTMLCGRHILVPTRQASEACKTVLTLPLSGLMIWNAIEKDEPMEKLLDLYGAFSRLEPEAREQRIRQYCQRLLELGFVIPKPTEKAAD